MPLELTDYERHYILTCPDALLILMDMHDMQQDQADSMDAGCYGDELRREELRQHGAKIIEADPGIWTDEIRRRFAGPTGYAAQRLVHAQQKVPSGVTTPPPAPQAVQGAPNDEGQGAICQPEGLMFDAQGRPRERYVRVAFGGHSCVVTPQEAAQISTDLIADRYVFKDVYLSKEEFDGLPEFNGF